MSAGPGAWAVGNLAGWIISALKEGGSFEITLCYARFTPLFLHALAICFTSFEITAQLTYYTVTRLFPAMPESVYLINVSLSSAGYVNDGIFCHFLASMFSGLVTTAASMPVDIAKTR